jgi:hypothetical protein
MPNPNLIHPIEITIQKINKSKTNYDTAHRAPIQQSTRKENIVIFGQVKWDETRMSVDIAGISIEVAGYVLFKRSDLIEKNTKIEFNDRFIKFGNQETSMYVVGLKYSGHYPDQNGSSLIKAFFSDRVPAKDGI